MATETISMLRHKSHVVVDGPDRAPARSMLRAVGLQDDDFKKPFVAVANLASDVTPCNVHLDRIAQKVKQGLRDANSVPFMFGTITISDGISMGTEGMKASLVSREVIGRFHRDRYLRRGHGWPHRSCRLRQEYARRYDGNGAAGCAVAVRLRRRNPARQLYGAGHQHTGYVRGMRRVLHGRDVAR